MGLPVLGDHLPHHPIPDEQLQAGSIKKTIAEEHTPPAQALFPAIFKVGIERAVVVAVRMAFLLSPALARQESIIVWADLRIDEPRRASTHLCLDEPARQGYLMPRCSECSFGMKQIIINHNYALVRGLAMRISTIKYKFEICYAIICNKL